MDGIELAKLALQKLEQSRQAADGLQVQIRQLEADMIAASEIGYIAPDGIDPSTRTKALLDRKRVLEAKENALRCHVKQVERALAALKESEREVLGKFFLSGLRPGEAVRLLEEKLHVSRSEVYRLREVVLWDFACRMGYMDDTPEKGKKR